MLLEKHSLIHGKNQTLTDTLSVIDQKDERSMKRVSVYHKNRLDEIQDFALWPVWHERQQ
jgi:hypothetical protein